MARIVIVGAGAAGLMAAGAAAAGGHDVTVLEHTDKPAQKILVTGKGRCNLTNACGEEEFLRHVRTNPRFLYSSLYAFPPEKTMRLFESLGVALKVERGRRVFPVSDKAAEVRAALLDTVRVSFNRISVDGDTSTNDTCCILANGMAGNAPITEKGPDCDAFTAALKVLCTELAKKMASDGEGASHLITCTVTGAEDEQSAETVAKSVIGSALTKAAIFGADANWGRVLCAMGYSGVDFDPDKVDVAFESAAGSIQVCAQGRGLDFDEDLAKKVLTEHDVTIAIAMGEGEGSCTCWGCDLTYEYVKINGDYRT